NYYTGLFVTAGVVLAYTVIGGFLAVSLTDFVQGSIMFIALILVPVAALFAIGGVTALETSIAAAAPGMQADGSPGPDRSAFFSW
ncbi:MAG: sodium:solute symporter family transporter, partial [Henriciella sp.]